VGTVVRESVKLYSLAVTCTWGTEGGAGSAGGAGVEGGGGASGEVPPVAPLVPEPAAAGGAADVGPVALPRVCFGAG
jgi:hypothetical protein